jgi:hypothetical protein
LLGNEYSDEVRNKAVKRAHYKDFAGARPASAWVEDKEDEETTMSGKEKVPEPEFVAFVGIDWADQKQVWSWQNADSRQQESGELEHRPEAVEAWVGELWSTIRAWSDRGGGGADEGRASLHVASV